MDQTHIGYTYWQEPPKNTMPPGHRASSPRDGRRWASPSKDRSAAWPGSARPAVLPTFDSYNEPRYFIDVFNRGPRCFEFTAVASASLDRAERGARLRRKRSTPVGERRLGQGPRREVTKAPSLSQAREPLPLRWKSMFSTRIGLRVGDQRLSSETSGYTFRWRRNITPARLTRGQ